MARAYITYRISGYGYKCPTELTEVLGTGNTRVNAHSLGRFNPSCMACSHWANVPETISVVALRALSTKLPPREAINREPQ